MPALMKKSKFIVLAAPSGSGKTTLVNKLLTEVKLNLEFSISATSRKPRKGEINGKNYFFLSKDDFLKKIENNEFLEWEEVYKDTFYGTLISELEVSISKNIIFDIDVIGGLNIKKKFPNQTLTIFIKPPSISELKSRLKKRKSETDSSIKIRIEKAKYEMMSAKEFDCIVENDMLEKSYTEVFRLVNNFINE